MNKWGVNGTRGDLRPLSPPLLLSFGPPFCLQHPTQSAQGATHDYRRLTEAASSSSLLQQAGHHPPRLFYGLRARVAPRPPPSQSIVPFHLLLSCKTRHVNAFISILHSSYKFKSKMTSSILESIVASNNSASAAHRHSILDSFGSPLKQRQVRQTHAITSELSRLE